MINREKLEEALGSYKNVKPEFGLTPEWDILLAAREYAKIMPSLELWLKEREECAVMAIHDARWLLSSYAAANEISAIIREME